MSFPFFQFMYPSMVNFDMSRGTPEGMLNTFGNFMISDLQARNWLYMTPIFNFNGVFQYPQFGGNFQLPNTVNNGSLFDFNPPQINTQNPFGFWNPILGNNNGTNNDSKVTTPEDQKKKDNVKKLVDTLKNIMKNMTLRDSVKSKVQYALDHYRDNKASLDDQLKTLKDAYKAIPSSAIEKYLIKSSVDNEDVSDLLKRAGYENTKTRNKDLTASKLKELKDGIESITDSSNDAQSTDLTSNARQGSIDILDLISAWNSIYPDENLVELLGNKYNEDIGMNKDAVYRRLSDVVGALLDEADKVINTEVDDELMLDETTIENINTLKETLSEALKKENDKVNTSTIKDAFNKLYATLRITEATIVQEKINRNYEFLGDSCGFAKDFIIKATEKDLQDEKLEGVGSEITLNEVEEEEEENNDELTPEQKAAKAVAATTKTLDSMTAYLVKNADGTYTEKRPDGDTTTAKSYQITSEGKIVNVETQEEVTAAEIRADINKAKKKLADAEANEDAYKLAKKKGADTYRRMHSWTTKTDTQKVNKYLGELNKDNIMGFLDGYWGANGGKKAHEGIIEIMDDDNAGHMITMENKKKFIKLIAEKAKELGITEADSYDLAEINRIRAQFEEFGAKADKDNFNTSWDPEGRPFHRGVRGFWKTLLLGLHTNYNERLDRHINRLYRLMKAKEAEQA